MTSAILRVSEWRMRRRFNRGRYYERVLAGQLSADLKRNTHPSRTKANEPFCTYTQEISYLDSGLEVARIHQYLRPDGKIGASGQPDPKRLFENGLWYRLRKPPANPWEAVRYFISDCRDRFCWLIGIEVN
jgi:hypothetical protein